MAACAVCRTDLHVVDGELTHPKLPLVPGHEIVGTVDAIGEGVAGLAPGERAGIAGLGWACGQGAFCASRHEKLWARPRFTGYTLDGGYAEATVADARYCFPLPGAMDPVTAAPLLCAGLIGYRTLAKAGDARTIGIYGFGAAAHLVAQVAQHQGREVYAFTRPGDVAAQQFALELGVAWAGGSDEPPPAALDAALIFAPVGALVPAALRAVRKGGIVVCGGIKMRSTPASPSAALWPDPPLPGLATPPRRDGLEFLELAGRVPLQVRTQPFPLEAANEALAALRAGRLSGAAVLVPGS